MILPALPGRQQAAFWLLVAAVGAAITWGVLRFVSPAPPRSLTLSTGASDGAYQQFGVRYREILRAEGIALILQPSTGSVENLARLNDGKTDVAFVQGGLGFLTLDPQADEERTALRALGTVAHEPVWIFSRGLDLSTGLGPLAGKRVAIGIAGSGNAKVARELLRVYGVMNPDGSGARGTQLLEEGGIAGALRLTAGEIDAMILIAAPQAKAVQMLLGDSTVQLASLRHAQGLTGRFPYLQTVTLRRGAVDPQRDLPARDVTLLATTANLVVTRELHPALASLLLQAAQQVHRQPTLISRAGEFPNAQSTDFPLSAEADRFFRDGRPFLQRYLPFWAANFAQRMLLVIVPLIAVLVPLLRVMPPLLAWRQRHRLFRRYGELKFLERDLASPTSRPRRAHRRSRGSTRSRPTWAARVSRWTWPTACTPCASTSTTCAGRRGRPPPARRRVGESPEARGLPFVHSGAFRHSYKTQETRQ